MNELFKKEAAEATENIQYILSELGSRSFEGFAFAAALKIEIARLSDARYAAGLADGVANEKLNQYMANR